MEFPTEDVDIPKAFTSMEGYEKWFEALNNKCSNTIGSQRLPIDYLLRDLTQKPPVADLETETVQVRFYWLAQYKGAGFAKDSKKLWSFIQQSLNDTTIYNTIKRFASGKSGYKALQTLNFQYRGGSAVSNNCTKALAEMKKLQYSNEQNFPFDKYAALFEGHFATLEDANRPLPDFDKVDKLLNGVVNILEDEIKSTVYCCRAEYPEDFAKC